MLELMYQKQNQKPTDKQRNRKAISLSLLYFLLCGKEKDKVLEQCWRNGAQGALKLETNINSTPTQQTGGVTTSNNKGAAKDKTLKREMRLTV